MLSLFNGKDLTGWTIHGTEKWYVENGELVCESGPDKQYGYLSTDKSYYNFELSVQFKLEANGNSGVFIRSGIEGTKISGWQVEVAPPDQHTGGIYESYGRGYGVVFRELTLREEFPFKWRELLITFRCLEDRGEVRGGRFVDGFLGEQFALPVAPESLRAARHLEPTGEIVTLSAADPLNLVGIIVPGERVPAISGKTITLRNGATIVERPCSPLAAVAGGADLVHDLSGHGDSR